MKWTVLIALALACGSTEQPPAPDPQAAATTPSTSNGQQAKEGQATKPKEPIEPEGPRTDLSKADPPYPASLVVPERFTFRTQLDYQYGDNHLRYATVGAAIESPTKDQTLYISIGVGSGGKEANKKKDYASKSKEVVYEKAGSGGAWAYATAARTACSVNGYLPASRISCYHGTSRTRCQEAERAEVKALVDACLSIRTTVTEEAKLEGPEYAFKDLVAKDQQQAAWDVAQAIVTNDAKALLAHWPASGVRIHGKRVKAAQVQSAKNLKKLLRWPGKPRSELDEADDTVTAVPDDELQFEAIAPAKGKGKAFDLYLHSGYEGHWDLNFKKDRSGKWMIHSIPDVGTYTL